MENGKLTQKNLATAFNDLKNTIIKTNHIVWAISDILRDCGTTEEILKINEFLNKHTTFVKDLTEILQEVTANRPNLFRNTW